MGMDPTWKPPFLQATATMQAMATAMTMGTAMEAARVTVMGHRRDLALRLRN